MGTPFIAFLEPSNLTGYDRTKPHSEQPAHIPKAFIDAMEVREQVFVEEQGVPLTNEFDSDDARACHWVSQSHIKEAPIIIRNQVVYASVNTTTEPEARDAEGNIVQRKKSVTRSTPIGTIRLVPFPHAPHPEPGSKFVFDPNKELSGPPPYIIDRATTYHDGKEPYIKLGRIAVVEEFRGSGISKILANAAMNWARENPTYFNPSIKNVGMEQMGATTLEEVPMWNGLVCVHAQEQVEKTWASECTVSNSVTSCETFRCPI
jgi:predicted GNAT family N-acyltransferase